MDWRGKGLIAACMVAIFSLITVQHRRIESLTRERDKYRTNTETLTSDIQTYRIRDSLNGARVQSLELTVREFERFRADDARLVQELKTRNRDLIAVNKAQSETIIALSAIPRDTSIIRDTTQMPAIAVHCGDAWFDFDGVLANGLFTGTLINRDSIILAETVRYKRFLWWKTKRVKDRQLDCVSMNPHTQIKGMEHIIIEK